jgi:hypothetical protein
MRAVPDSGNCNCDAIPWLWPMTSDHSGSISVHLFCWRSAAQASPVVERVCAGRVFICRYQGLATCL